MKNKAGFTLIELIIVMAIIAITAGLSMSSLVKSQRNQLYNNTFNKILSLFSNARSLAITGKGQLDFSDYDHDNCNNLGAILPAGTCTSSDYMTPANYGVHLDSSAASNNLILFADINPPATGALGLKGRFDSGTNYAQGNDLNLDTLTLPTDMRLEILGSSLVTSGSIFYSPNYADISLETVVASPFVTIKLIDGQLGNLCSQLKIHKKAGVPEVGSCT